MKKLINKLSKDINMGADTNGWIEYRALILSELKTLNTEVTSMREEQVKIREDIATLKVKSGIWGLAGGLIPVLITLAVYFFKTMG